MMTKRQARRAADFPGKKRKVKPATKKRKVVTRPAGGKPKKAISPSRQEKTPAPSPPAGERPEFAISEHRPAFVPRPYYFTGGGIARRLRIPEGFVLASDPHPGPEYRLACVRSIRTAPEGETIKLHRYALKESVREDLAAKALRLKQECELDDLQSHNARVSRADRFLLLIKQIATSSPKRERRNK